MSTGHRKDPQIQQFYASTTPIGIINTKQPSNQNDLIYPLKFLQNQDWII